MGVWVRSPQRGPGAEPLFRGPRGFTPEAKSLVALQRPKEGENLTLLSDFSVVFKVSNTVRILDIMISQKPVVTKNLLPSNDKHYSL